MVIQLLTSLGFMMVIPSICPIGCWHLVRFSRSWMSAMIIREKSAAELRMRQACLFRKHHWSSKVKHISRAAFTQLVIFPCVKFSFSWFLRIMTPETKWIFWTKKWKTQFGEGVYSGFLNVYTSLPFNVIRAFCKLYRGSLRGCLRERLVLVSFIANRKPSNLLWTCCGNANLIQK